MIFYNFFKYEIVTQLFVQLIIYFLYFIFYLFIYSFKYVKLIYDTEDVVNIFSPTC